MKCKKLREKTTKKLLHKQLLKVINFEKLNFKSLILIYEGEKSEPYHLISQLVIPKPVLCLLQGLN